MRLTTLPILTCTAILLLTSAAHAQLSVPDALTTQFDAHLPQSIVDLNITLDPNTQTRDTVTFGGLDELTVRTDKSGKGTIDNVHANGRFIQARAHVTKWGRWNPSGSWVTVSNESIAATDNIDDSRTLINVSGDLNRRSLAWQISLPQGSSARLGFERQEYHGGGSTNLYDGTFNIFPQTPPVAFFKVFDTASLDYVSPLWRGWRAEAVLAHQRSPGRVTLASTSPAVSLSMPIVDSGNETILSLSRSISNKSRVVVLHSHGSWTGDASVDRENERSIGDGDSRRGLNDLAAAIFYATTKVRRFALYYDTRHDSWHTSGNVTSGEDLGLPISFVGAVAYDAAYDLRVNTAGAYFEHDIGANHTLRLGYDWVNILPRLDSDYAAQVILLSANGSGTTGGQWLKGHRLDVTYTITHKSLSIRLIGVQAIPLNNSSSNSSNSGGGGGGGGSSSSRRSDGGRLLSTDITLAF